MVKVQNEEKMALLLGRNTEERGERWVISVLQRKLCMKCLVGGGQRNWFTEANILKVEALPQIST